MTLENSTSLHTEVEGEGRDIGMDKDLLKRSFLPILAFFELS